MSCSLPPKRAILAAWIDELASRRRFVVPAVSHPLLTALVARVAGIRADADDGDLTAERMLSITAALEFSEMDDLFAAICRRPRPRAT